MHNRRRNKMLVIAAIALAAALGSAVPCRAQEQYTLRRIEVVGWQKLSADQIIQISGLEVGNTVTAAAVEAAADKLLKSGLLRSVSYRIRMADGDMTVIFEVVEKPAAPVTGEALGEVQWIGNQALSSAELSLAFGLRPGDAADRPKINKGLEAVRKAYARKGYVNTSIEDATTRDESMRRTNYRFTIREGQQYRMGALTVTGLNANDERRLKSRWTLAPEAVFDDSYIEEFRQSVMRPFVANLTQRTGTRTRFEVNTKPNIEKQTVDVLITFK
jgi:outer membrane protein insertion porin family